MIAVVVGLGWAVAFPQYRQVDVFSPTLMVALLAGLGTASLVLARSTHSPEASAVDVFLVSVIAAVGLSAVLERINPIPLLDPFSVTALGAVLAAVGAALIWDLSVVSYLLVGLGIAVALLAGEVCRRCCAWGESFSPNDSGGVGQPRRSRFGRRYLLPVAPPGPLTLVCK